MFILLDNLSFAQLPSDGGSDISPLMSAVNSDDIEGVRFFSRAGKVVLNERNIGGATALHIASRNNNLEIIRILINSGANVDAIDNDRWTPLMRASAGGNSRIVSELLINKANANKKNSFDETAIIHSVNSGCSSCLGLVLDYINYNKIDKYFLKGQFEEAFLIASRKGDSKIRDILSQYQSKIKSGHFTAVFSGHNKALNLVNANNKFARKKALSRVLVYRFGDGTGFGAQDGDLLNTKSVSNAYSYKTEKRRGVSSLFTGGANKNYDLTNEFAAGFSKDYENGNQYTLDSYERQPRIVSKPKVQRKILVNKKKYSMSKVVSHNGFIGEDSKKYNFKNDSNVNDDYGLASSADQYENYDQFAVDLDDIVVLPFSNTAADISSKSLIRNKLNTKKERGDGWGADKAYDFIEEEHDRGSDSSFDSEFTKYFYNSPDTTDEYGDTKHIKSSITSDSSNSGDAFVLKNGGTPIDSYSLGRGLEKDEVDEEVIWGDEGENWSAGFDDGIDGASSDLRGNFIEPSVYNLNNESVSGFDENIVAPSGSNSIFYEQSFSKDGVKTSRRAMKGGVVNETDVNGYDLKDVQGSNYGNRSYDLKKYNRRIVKTYSISKSK